MNKFVVFTLYFGITSIAFTESLFIYKLNYRVTPEPTISAPDYDGIVFVSSQQPINDSVIPEAISNAISKAAKVNGALYKEGGVVEVDGIPAGRLVYAPVGPLTDYHDVRSYGEAAKKAIEKALKANIKAPLLILHPNSNPKFPHAELVTLLGALEALYVNIQYREDCPDKCPKVKNLGVWGPEYTTTVDIVNMAANLEDGRIVARDITDADPERMSPLRVEEYIREVFPPESGVNISVISDPEQLKKEFPLFAAVNRAASTVERHAGRIIFLTYESNTPVVDTVLLVGKGVTYDTGGADIKTQGYMASMSRDKGGAAAVAGFMKVLAETRVGGLKVVAALCLTRNSVGENSFVADEVITARSGKRVRVVNTDAEGRMVMADLLCYMKELVEKGNVENPHIISVATLTGHALSSVGPGYSIVMNNGPAAKSAEGKIFKEYGEKIGEPLEVSTLRKEDFDVYKGTAQGDDLVNSNKNSRETGRGHQGPAAFLIMASGLDKHELDSAVPIKFSHWDIAGSVGDLPGPATGAPVLALANRFIMRLEDPAEEGFH
ncbi:putative aminopeptidase W07G4.4 [Macrosteles quadrilineatus]|uniref:putative aminopeptidase W07G4.4 n=1 Tax=Macrosteles quadrilineatus TaxID=74068 RepID=UPI0023E26E1B|nr:putative aminopeptidase W07G4.4 [Macrosteles quadrilineatus]